MSLAVDTPDVSAFHRAETYNYTGGEVKRTVRLRSGTQSVSTAPVQTLGVHADPAKAYQVTWLRSRERPEGKGRDLAIADIFSGCGGLSVGAHEAAHAVGRSPRHILAVDTDKAALGVFGENFREAELEHRSINDVVDGDIGARLTPTERRLSGKFHGLDLVIGGPPCQGHSDLNNHTRRNDPRNLLYLRMVRFVEVTRPEHVLIENVPGVVRDRTRVVEIAEQALQSLGYSVTSGILVATDFGAAQKRRRHVLMATKQRENIASLNEVTAHFGKERSLNVMDAIADLVSNDRGGIFDSAARHHEVNQQRISYLFEHDLYDLPNSERPDCHRLKPHSYNAVYGRMHPDEPAPTITAGFGSTGQGRFVHPTKRRTITPHEAARLQGFPDWFRFDTAPTRTALQEMIGNAVPSQLGYAAIASLIR